jgi:hypothetical protein
MDSRQCRRVERLHQQRLDARHDRRHVPVNGPDCRAGQMIARVVPVRQTGHPVRYSVPASGERLFELGLPVPEEPAHTPLLPGSALPTTCFSTGDYWADTQALLVAQEETRKGLQTGGFGGSQTQSAVFP